MVELIVGTYGVVCWLVLVKFKLVPVNVYTIFTAMAGGVVILVLLFVCLSVFHPVSHDGRMYAPVVQIVPEVRGVVIDVPVEGNKPLKKGDVLFRIEPRPFQIEVDRLRASLAGKNSKFAQLAERKVRTEFNAQIDGQNPEVRETMALLDKARYDLDQTIVRAPTNGYVP